MQALNRLAHKPLDTPSLLCITYRLLTTHNPNPNPSPNPNPNPFPDQPSSAFYDDLIDAAGRSGDLDTVRHLLNKRIRNGFFNTNKTFKFISTNLSVLDDLLQTLSRLDEGFPRKSAYDSLVACLSKLRRTDEALRVVDAMVLGGFGANASTFHPILIELTREKKMEEAWLVMELMREREIPPDLTAYNYLLMAYCSAGDLTRAAEVLTRIGDDGMEADKGTYDALVLGACRAGKVEGALVVLRRMADEGVPVLYSTHMHVIGSLLKLGYYAQAVEFVMSYGGFSKGLDTESFGILGNRLINLKRFDEAKMVVKEMRTRGLAMGCKLNDFYDLHIKN